MIINGFLVRILRYFAGRRVYTFPGAILEGLELAGRTWPGPPCRTWRADFAR